MVGRSCNMVDTDAEDSDEAHGAGMPFHYPTDATQVTKAQPGDLMMDKAEILAGIDDVDQFDAHLQHLLFEDLFPSWRSLDATEQFHLIGQIVRWETMCRHRLSHDLLGVGEPEEELGEDSRPFWCRR